MLKSQIATKKTGQEKTHKKKKNRQATPPFYGLNFLSLPGLIRTFRFLYCLYYGK